MTGGAVLRALHSERLLDLTELLLTFAREHLVLALVIHFALFGDGPGGFPYLALQVLELALCLTFVLVFMALPLGRNTARRR